MSVAPAWTKDENVRPNSNLVLGRNDSSQRIQAELKQILRFGENEHDIFLVDSADEERSRLFEELKISPESPEAWWALLQCKPSFPAKRYSLLRLYRRATTIIPKETYRQDPTYVKIWIAYALLHPTAKDTRDTFKYMKLERIGELCAEFYAEFARFERKNENFNDANILLDLAVQKGALSEQEVKHLMTVVDQESIFNPVDSSTDSMPSTSSLTTTHSLHDRLSRLKVSSSMAVDVPQTPSIATSKMAMRIGSRITSETKPSLKPLAAQQLRSLSTRKVTTTSRLGGPVRVLTSASKEEEENCAIGTEEDEEGKGRGNGNGNENGIEEKEKSSTFSSSSSLSLSSSSSSASSASSASSPDKEGPKCNITTITATTTAARADTQPALSSMAPSLPRPINKDIKYIKEWLPSRDRERSHLNPPVPTTSLLSRANQKSQGMSENKSLANENQGKDEGTGTGKDGGTSAGAEEEDDRSANEGREERSDADLGKSGSKMSSALATDWVEDEVSMAQEEIISTLTGSSPHLDRCQSSGTEESPSSEYSDQAARVNPFQYLITPKNIFAINGRSYLKLEEIGRGGSSKVYRILGEDFKFYALKKIKLKRMDALGIEQYENEITLLRRLQPNKYIIRLVAAATDKQNKAIYVIMEHGEMDLNQKLQQLQKADEIDENFLRITWQQMLKAVDAIHQNRIVHGDLKPANFLFVNGALKLIDFGIAKAIGNDTTNIVRDGQVGTVNFMSPEAIVGTNSSSGLASTTCMKVSRASDIWSLGCILYQMVHGQPPFGDVPSLIQKLKRIVDPKHAIQFPPLKNRALQDTIVRCLQRDPNQRPPINGKEGLLHHPFLRPELASCAKCEKCLLV